MSPPSRKKFLAELSRGLGPLEKEAGLKSHIFKGLGSLAAGGSGSLLLDRIAYPEDWGILDTFKSEAWKGERAARGPNALLNLFMVGGGLGGLMSGKAVLQGVGGTSMVTAPIKDVALAAINPLGAVSKLFKDLEKERKANQRWKWGLGAATVGALGLGAAHLFKKRPDPRITTSAAPGGHVRITLPTKDPGDNETTIEMPLDEIQLSNALKTRLRRDVRKRLRAGSKERTLKRDPESHKLITLEEYKAKYGEKAANMIGSSGASLANTDALETLQAKQQLGGFPAGPASAPATTGVGAVGVSDDPAQQAIQQEEMQGQLGDAQNQLGDAQNQVLGMEKQIADGQQALQQEQLKAQGEIQKAQLDAQKAKMEAQLDAQKAKMEVDLAKKTQSSADNDPGVPAALRVLHGRTVGLMQKAVKGASTKAPLLPNQSSAAINGIQQQNTQLGTPLSSRSTPPPHAAPDPSAAARTGARDANPIRVDAGVSGAPETAGVSGSVGASQPAPAVGFGGVGGPADSPDTPGGALSKYEGEISPGLYGDNMRDAPMTDLRTRADTLHAQNPNLFQQNPELFDQMVRDNAGNVPSMPETMPDFSTMSPEEKTKATEILQQYPYAAKNPEQWERMMQEDLRFKNVDEKQKDMEDKRVEWEQERRKYRDDPDVRFDRSLNQLTHIDTSKPITSYSDRPWWELGDDAGFFEKKLHGIGKGIRGAQDWAATAGRNMLVGGAQKFQRGTEYRTDAVDKWNAAKRNFGEGHYVQGLDNMLRSAGNVGQMTGSALDIGANAGTLGFSSMFGDLESNKRKAGYAERLADDSHRRNLANELGLRGPHAIEQLAARYPGSASFPVTPGVSGPTGHPGLPGSNSGQFGAFGQQMAPQLYQSYGYLNPQRAAFNPKEYADYGNPFMNMALGALPLIDRIAGTSLAPRPTSQEGMYGPPQGPPSNVYWNTGSQMRAQPFGRQ